MIVLLGCFILAFGWFGFNPGSTLGAAANGNLRISSVAVNTMLAGMAGSFGAMYYMWIRYGKPDASMTGNGLLAGLVAITAPSGFVNPMASVIIGLIAGVLCALSVEFVERVLKLDDVVGAISVHGTNGIWGVISVGLFADGKSNYAGAWNGVPGSVTGLFYGDAGQLVAQLMGVATLIGFVFTFSFVAEHDPRGGLGPPRDGEGRARRSGHPGNGRARLSGVRAQGRAGATRSRTPCPPHSSPTQRRVFSRGPTALPPVPWRDPHAVSPADLAAYIQQLEAGLPRQPAVGRSAHLPRHGARRELRRLQVDGRARGRARRSIPSNFWAQLKYAELHYRLRALNRAEEETRQGRRSRRQPVPARHGAQADAGDPDAEARAASATSTGPSR